MLYLWSTNVIFVLFGLVLCCTGTVKMMTSSGSGRPPMHYYSHESKDSPVGLECNNRLWRLYCRLLVFTIRSKDDPKHWSGARCWNVWSSLLLTVEQRKRRLHRKERKKKTNNLAKHNNFQEPRTKM